MSKTLQPEVPKPTPCVDNDEWRPALPHRDSALLDRIAEDFRQCVGEHNSNSLEFAVRVRGHLRNRSAGQNGGGQ